MLGISMLSDLENFENNTIRIFQSLGSSVSAWKWGHCKKIQPHTN